MKEILTLDLFPFLMPVDQIHNCNPRTRSYENIFNPLLPNMSTWWEVFCSHQWEQTGGQASRLHDCLNGDHLCVAVVTCLVKAKKTQNSEATQHKRAKNRGGKIDFECGFAGRFFGRVRRKRKRIFCSILASSTKKCSRTRIFRH